MLTALSVINSHAQTRLSAEDYLRSAAAHIKQKETDAALNDLNEALKLNPAHPAAFLLRANLREQKGDLEGARADYDRAIELAPSAPGMEVAYTNRGTMRMRGGDAEAAIEDFNRAIKLNPKEAAIYNQRAIAWLQVGAHDRALADYEKALELNPRLPSAHYGVGYYHARKGDWDAATAAYTRAIELFPTYAHAYVSRGVVRGMRGDLDGAAIDIKKGAALDPQSISEQRKGKFSSPFEELNKIVAANPTNPRAYALRGFIRLLQGKETEAGQEFRKSIEIEPELKIQLDRLAKEFRPPGPSTNH